MTIQELTAALRHSREQLFQAELKIDQVTEPELIDAAIYECKAWETRYSFYNRKIREAVKNGQTIPRQRIVCFGGRR